MTGTLRRRRRILSYYGPYYYPRGDMRFRPRRLKVNLPTLNRNGGMPMSLVTLPACHRAVHQADVTRAPPGTNTADEDVGPSCPFASGGIVRHPACCRAAVAATRPAMDA